MRESVRNVHFIGIGGIGMRGIAEVLLGLNFRVSGSDVKQSAVLQRLQTAGARVQQGHRAENIRGADAVVVSSAVAEDNVELQAARAENIPVLPRAAMLGELMRFRKGIAIAGTHGKTTTTSLVAAVLTRAGCDPTYVIGGVVNSAQGICGGARLGQGKYMVAEADESDASFLHLQPQIAVLTNVDADHLSAYGGSFAKLQKACLAFLHNLPFYGLAVLCFEDATVRKIAAKLHKPMLSYGFGADVDFRAVKVRQVGEESFFEVRRRDGGKGTGEYRLALPGRHNVLNALAAIALVTHLGIDEAHIREALARFEGIGRRFERLGEVALGDGGAVELVDDYAHHPSELAATLQAARDCWEGRRLVVVFQPHRYTRTRDLFDDFVEVLVGVEVLVLTQVYSAGEAEIAGSGTRSLCRALRKRGGEPVFIEELEGLYAALPNILRAGDVLLTMGAGDIGGFASELAEGGFAGLQKKSAGKRQGGGGKGAARKTRGGGR